MTSNKIYFPGLNALRFFAALAVLVCHIELIKNNISFGKDLYSENMLSSTELPIQKVLSGKTHFLTPIFSDIGTYGVVFFFVLSGFLITYLLLVEKDKTTTISFSSFIMRRVLRIWPLYYLILILGFFILPELDIFYIKGQTELFLSNYWPNFFLYLFFLPNLALAIFPVVPNIGQAWSVGVEEQFYVMWPLALKYFKNPLKFIIGFLVLFVGFKAVVALIGFDSRILEILKKFLAATKMECMAIGGLGAIIIYQDWKKVKALVFHKVILPLALISVLICFYINNSLLQDGMHLLTSVLFLVIILNVSCNENTWLKLENKVLNFLGRISYGIYMYHMLICTMMVNLVYQNFYESRHSLVVNSMLYLTVIGLTILVSYLSYTYLEKPFLRIKDRYQKVKSSS